MIKYKTVEEFMLGLDADIKAQVELLRRMIMSAEPTLTEHVKWNAPSYVYAGEDRITFNITNKENKVKLVFHMGATRREDKKASPIMQSDTGLIQWVSDIRGLLVVDDIDDIYMKQPRIIDAVREWLAVT